MNFVKGETIIQEITADGKVRDIVDCPPEDRRGRQGGRYQKPS